MQTYVFFKYGILLIAYTLITVCCEALQTIMDLALYKINYKSYIFLYKIVTFYQLI